MSHQLPVHAGNPPLLATRAMATIWYDRYLTYVVCVGVALLLHQRDGTHASFCGIQSSIFRVRSELACGTIVLLQPLNLPNLSRRRLLSAIEGGDWESFGAQLGVEGSVNQGKELSTTTRELCTTALAALA